MYKTKRKKNTVMLTDPESIYRDMKDSVDNKKKISQNIFEDKSLKTKKKKQIKKTNNNKKPKKKY